MRLEPRGSNGQWHFWDNSVRVLGTFLPEKSCLPKRKGLPPDPVSRGPFFASLSVPSFNKHTHFHLDSCLEIFPAWVKNLEITWHAKGPRPCLGRASPSLGGHLITERFGQVEVKSLGGHPRQETHRGKGKVGMPWSLKILEEIRFPGA